MRLYRTILWKAYFDKGWSLTSYIKYAIALFGLASLDVKSTMIIGIIYGLACLVLGRIWFKYKLIETENEIGNIFNPFQKQVRQKLQIETFK